MVINGNKIIDETYSKQVKECEKIRDFTELFKEYYKTDSEEVLKKIVEGFQVIIIDATNHFRDNLNICNADIMDLIQECNMTLCNALKHKTYNIKSKVKPTTYFYSVFLNTLKDYTGYNKQGFCSTPYTTSKVSQVKKYLEDIQKGVSVKKAMKKYKLTDQDIINYSPKLVKSMYDTISNNNDNERDTYIIDTIYDDNNEHIDEVLNKECLYEILKSNLSELDYNILIKRYVEGYSAKEVSYMFDIPISEVYDSCSKSITVLRKDKRLQELKDAL